MWETSGPYGPPQTVRMSEAQFDLERSRSYWRHPPTGQGKADTSVLAALDDRRLCDTWDDGFRGRFLNYPEEEQFLRTFSRELRGKRLLSVGSGLGFHELYYAAAGADVTCADIVESNVGVIERVARLKGVQSVAARYVATGDVGDLGADFDVVFLYGCLMHMPHAQQRALMTSARRALSPHGRIVLMVYSWEFARRLCGWTSQSQFDPVLFGRRSDPVVDSDACPWADWYDDAKLVDLAPGMGVARKQTWNDEQYLWYELSQDASRAPDPFFRPSDLAAGKRLARVPLRRFEAADAILNRSWRGIIVETGASGSNYAASAAAGDSSDRANAVVASLDVTSGACSVGVLDEDENRFVATAVVASPGPHDVLLLIPRWPGRARIVFSNHQPASPQPSRFVIRRVRVLQRSIAEPPRPRLTMVP
jgi:SAM-dependent methyltransferase